MNEGNDCSKEEEWFHFFVKVKRALKIFFILDDFSIFSDSVMSCEDFFIYKKMIFRLTPPKQGNGL